MAAPTPVTVVIDGPRPPAWQARVLELIDRSPRLALAAVRVEPTLKEGRLWRLHRQIERQLFGIAPDALAPVAAEAHGDDDATSRLLVWLAAGPPPDDCGPVLRPVHGPGRERAGRAFARAVVDGDDSVETEIRLIDGQVTVLARTVSGVRPFSACLSANHALWKSAELVVRAAERLPEAAGSPAAPPVAGRRGRLPLGLRLLMVAPRRWLRVLVTRLIFRRPWSIIVRRRQPWGVGWSDEAAVCLSGLPGDVHADPFLFEHEGCHHLFCERIPAGSSKGVIAHTELRDGEPTGQPRTVLEASHHLSYPFVFEHRGEILLVAESSAARRVELHRAIHFPHEWCLDAVLIDDLQIADATLLEHAGRWWLFAGVAAEGASIDELHLYYADDPRGPWAAHPLNPVVSDARGARPAGAILRCGERLVRPAQDCSRRYGWAVSMRAIDVLDTSDYREHEIDRLNPAGVDGARAVHTYSRDSSYEAIDRRRREPRSRVLRAILRGRGGRRV